MINGVVSVTWLFLNLVAAKERQKIVEGPKSTVAVINSVVTLRCRAKNQVGQVHWTKDDFNLGFDRMIDPDGRRQMVGHNDMAEFHLQIRNVSLRDEASYQCFMSPTETQPLQMSKRVQVTVIVPPKPPKIENQAAKIAAAVGRPTRVDCRTEGARPAAEITWLVAKDSGGTQVLRVVDQFAKNRTNKRDQDYFDTESSLRYVPVKGDKNGHLVCKVLHDALKKPLITSSHLVIQYKPEISITTNVTGSLPREGSSLLLTCLVNDANPSNVKLEWWQGNSKLGEMPNLALSGLRVDKNHGKVYTCRARNEVGTAEETYKLNMSFAPHAKRLSEAKISTDEEAGSAVTMACSVVGNPVPTVRWYKGNSKKVLHTGSRFTIEKVKIPDGGKYRCSASALDFPVDEKEFTLIVKGPPTVRMVKKVPVAEGEDVKITCTLSGHPYPKRPEWYKRSSCEENDSWMLLSEIVDKQDRHRFKFGEFEERAGSAVAFLRIQSLVVADLGCYNCSVSTQYGDASAFSHVTKSEALPWYFLIPAIVVGSALFVALVACLCCINRRSICKSTKSSQPEHDSDVDVKVEAVDGGAGVHRYYTPELYASDSLDPPAYNGKDYILIPSEGHDIDNLPPPYPMNIASSSNNYYTVSNTPKLLNTQSNGGLSHVTYLTDDSSPLMNQQTPVPMETYLVANPAGTVYPETNYVVVTAGNPYPHSFSDYGLPQMNLTNGGLSHHSSPYVARVTSELTSDPYRTDPIYSNGFGGLIGGTLPRAALYTPIKSHSPILVGPSRSSPHDYGSGYGPAVTTVSHMPVTAVANAYPVSTGIMSTLETVKEMPTPEEQFAIDSRAMSQQSTHV
nr:kirrel [Pontonema vulgare]